MKTMRDKYEHFNDNLWLDATHERAYYNGKVQASLNIDKWLGTFDNDNALRSNIIDAMHTEEAHRDVEEGESYAEYDGMVAGYREMLEEMGYYEEKD